VLKLLKEKGRKRTPCNTAENKKKRRKTHKTKLPLPRSKGKGYTNLIFSSRKEKKGENSTGGLQSQEIECD